jgi:hypothetical protein
LFGYFPRFFLIIPFFCTAVNGKQHRRFLISPASEAEEEKKCKTGQAAEALERHLLSSEFADSQVSAFLDGQTVGNRAVILWMYRRLLMWCRIF